MSLFAFLWAWSDFIFASTLDGGGDRQPITLGIYHYIGNNNQQWNAIMATAVVASVPAAVLLVIAQRYVAAGVTAGAVKTDPLPLRSKGTTFMTVATGPVFSLQEIPFSYRGSWFDFSPVVAEKTYAEDVHLVSHQTGMQPILRLIPIAEDARAETTVTATPDRLTWTCDAGRIELAYEKADAVRMRGQGLGLRVLAADPVLTPFSGPYFFQDPGDGSWVFTVVPDRAPLPGDGPGRTGRRTSRRRRPSARPSAAS